MRTRVILVAMLIAFAAWPAFARAQTPADESAVAQASNLLRFIKSNIDKMTEELDSARKNQDVKKSNCLEARLRDLKKVYQETQSLNQQLREAAFARETARISELAYKVKNNQDVAQQLVKLVNLCYGQINEVGGFTETVEEFMGQAPLSEETDYGRVRRADEPEPLPPEYEPEPVSQSEES